MRVRLGWALMTVVWTSACSPPLEPEPTFWGSEDARPDLQPPFFAAHGLDDLSLYAQRVAGADRPEASHRGPLAVGNGRAFSMYGLADPVNRMHNAVGPTYRKGDRFFGDQWFTLVVDGEERAFDEEWIARPRGTGLVVTRADAGDVSLYTVDAAPRVGGQAVPGILRFFIVHSESAHTVSLKHTAVQDLVDGVEITSDGRQIAWLGWPDAPVDGTLDLGDVPADGEVQAALVAAMGESSADLAAVQAQMDASTPELWLDETVSWWSAFSEQGLQLHSDDPRVNDLYDGMRASLEVQRTHGGGVSPMSRYTGVWLRDTIGPTRFLLRAGRFEDARTGLDYLYACHVDRGDYGNACSSELDPTAVGPEPDWDALGSFGGGRTGAEGPSYVPLAYRDYANWTADDALTRERWSYLRRALVAQEMNEDGLQGWSGDETFRLVMGASLGFPLEYDWPGLSYSSNSSFLMVAAADYMRAASENADDEATFAELAERSRRGLDEHFWLEDHFSPFIFHTAGSDNEADYVEQRPFEDVNLKALWTGAFAPDDPRALSDLQFLIDSAGRGDGTFQTQIDEEYDAMYGVSVEEGVATGMVPGYALTALLLTGAPEAEQAFNALHSYAGPSGQYPEDLLYDDKSALQIVYDERGGLGDIAARYRPWEGGINLDAMLAYLLGAEPIEGGMRLRPHLPNQQRHLYAEQLRVGVGEGKLELHRSAGELTARFESTAEQDFALVVDLVWPEAASGGLAIDVHGAGSSELVVLPRGERLFRVSFPQVAPGEVVGAALTWTRED